MANPVPAAGYGRYDDGTMVVLREAGEGSRVHAVGIYTSPYCDPDVYEPPVPSASFFGRVGNPELVAVLGECFALARDVERSGFNEAGFEAITVRCRSLLDTYGWLAEPEATAVAEQVRRLGKTAGQILDEFAAVTAARKVAHDAVQQAAADVGGLPRRCRHRAARHGGVHRPPDRGERPARAARGAGRAALRRHRRGRRSAGRRGRRCTPGWRSAPSSS